MGMRYPQEQSFRLLYDEVNRLFRELLQADPAAERLLETMVIPAVDIHETAEAVILEVEIPGADAARIQVTSSGGKVTIDGVKDERLEPGRINYLCMERSFGRFQRVIPIHCAVNVRESRAVYRRGILTITLPKIAEKRGGPAIISVVKIDDPEGNRE